MAGSSSRGFFDPPIGRKTSIIVLKRRISEEKEDVRIVTSLSTLSSTEVFQIDPRSGSLQFGTPEHTFTDEASAVESLYRQGYVEVVRGGGLLGFVATESLAGVYVALHTLPKATLPGGHSVQLVMEAQWIMCQLDKSVSYDERMTLAEQDFWRLLQQNNVAGTHYFCETVDLSRPFPSGKDACDPDQEFVWNHFLSKDFRKLGMVSHCPCLLQGAVESAEHVHVTGQRYTIAHISRRSRRHPGTRYLARGLNKFAGPGNEIEAEMIVWKNPVGGKDVGVEWCRNFWRRGTVPIWWGVEIQPLNKGLHAEVYVRDEQTYVGSLTYFKSLLSRVAREYNPSNRKGSSNKEVLETFLSSGNAEDAITCINLLHCNPKKAAELLLSSHYQEGIRHVKERLGQHGGSSLRLLNFDWHGTMSCLTEEKGVEAFWHFIEQPVESVGFAAGWMKPKKSASEPDESPWGAHWKMCWKKRQKGLLRFNCADSLDRTNAASCFAIMPVLQQSLKYLGIQLDMMEQAKETKKLQTLPPGWEVRKHGGRLLYIDHNSKKTQWEHPGMLGKPSSLPVEDAPPWVFFSYSLSDIQQRLYPSVIHDFVEMFRKHGDINSELYTGSAAMHSHILGIVLGNDIRSYGSSSSVGKLQNLKVAVQRRWNNTISDAPRQQSIELFLGLNIFRHFPALSQSPHLIIHDGDDDIFHTQIITLEEATEAKSVSHLGKELDALHLKKHDGKLALEEDIPFDAKEMKSDDDLLGFYNLDSKSQDQTSISSGSDLPEPPNLL